MNERHLLLEFDAQDNTKDEFDQVKRNVLELRDLEVSANQASREAIAIAKQRTAADNNRSREKIANTNKERAAEANASRESVAETRRQQNAETLRSREKISNINAENQRRRLAGQAESRQIQRLRLQEQRRAREQRANLSALRSQQGGILRGFNGWSTALGTAAGILGVDLIGALGDVARRTLEVTKNFEQLRLGYASFTGSAQLADAQIARIRTLADLPSVSFEGGIRSALQLQSAGFDFKTSERLITELSNQVALFGGSTEALNRVLYQFVQVGGLQQFRQEELRQITEIVPGFRQVLTDVFGTFRGEDIQKAIAASGITFEEAMERVITELESRPRAPADTLTNNLENLTEAWNDLLRDLGHIALPALTEAIQGLRRVIDQMRTIIGAPGTFIDTIALLYENIPKQLGFGQPQGMEQRLREFVPIREAFTELFLSDYGQELLEKALGKHGINEASRGAFQRISDFEQSAVLSKPKLDAALKSTRDLFEQVQQFSLTDEERASIRERFKAGESYAKIAKDYTVSSTTIEAALFHTGKLTEETVKKLTDGHISLIKPLRDVIAANEQRLETLRKDYIASRDIQDQSREEREKRYQIYKTETDIIERSNEALRKFVGEREKELAATQAQYKEVVKRRLQDRQFPIDVFAPDPNNALPGGTKSATKYFNEELGKTLREYFGTGRPILPREMQRFERRDAIPRGVAPGSDSLDNILPHPLNRPRQVIAPTGVGLPPSQIAPDLSLPNTAARELLEPHRAAGAIRDAQRLLEELKEFRQESDRLTKSLEGSDLSETFSPQRLKFVEESRKELIEMHTELIDLQTVLGELKNIPPELQGAYQRLFLLMKLGAEDASKEIEKLDNLLGKLRRYSGPKMFDEMGNLVQQRTDSITETFTAPTPIPTRTTQPRPSDTAIAIQQHLQRSGGSLYDQFIAPSILDAVGIKSGRAAARERAIADLKESINRQTAEIQQGYRDRELNERDRNDALLELKRTFEQEKRAIERQYEEERMDAWKNWVRQQITDIPKLIFEQLKLQFAARATNAILNSLGIGGNRIPIQGGGLLDRAGSLFGRATATQQYSAPIGPGLSGAQTVGGASVAGTAATAGTIVSAALAAHNIGTAIVPQWNPHGTSAYDIVGEDLASAITAPFRTFWDNMHFAVPTNDAYAHMLGRSNALEQMKNMAASRGQESARDLADHYDKGMREGQQNTDMSDYVVIHKDANINLSTTIEMLDDKLIRNFTFRAEELKSEGRL